MYRKCLLFLPFLSLFASYPTLAEEDSVRSDKAFAPQRRAMVEEIAAMGVRNKQVLEVMQRVPRHLFVPEKVRALSYSNSPLPIGLEQTISQPYIVAFMTEALQLKPKDRVLEIGTGSGYQAVVLGELVDSVYTIELIPELGKRAEGVISKLEYGNVHVRIGDGYQGWPEKAPFDAIMVTAAPPEIPEVLVEQLKEGGRMIVPVGKERQELIILRKEGGEVSRESLLPVRFVPMVRSQ